MREENREGLILRRYDLGDGVERVLAANWKLRRRWFAQRLSFYTTPSSRALSKAYVTGPMPGRIGNAYPRGERHLEAAAHPVVAMRAVFGEFAGFDRRGLLQVAERINWELERRGTRFRASADIETIEEAVAAGYLHCEGIRGKRVYFPTEKGARPMCNTAQEEFTYKLGMAFGGMFMGSIGHRRANWD